MESTPSTQPNPPNPSLSPPPERTVPTDITEFGRMARRHLTLVVGRVQLLRRAARRGTVDLDQCVGRLDDIELSVHRLTMLVAALERTVEPGKPPSPLTPGLENPSPPVGHTKE